MPVARFSRMPERGGLCFVKASALRTRVAFVSRPVAGAMIKLRKGPVYRSDCVQDWRFPVMC